MGFDTSPNLLIPNQVVVVFNVVLICKVIFGVEHLIHEPGCDNDSVSTVLTYSMTSKADISISFPDMGGACIDRTVFLLPANIH